MSDDLLAVKLTLVRARARWIRLTATRAVGRWSSAVALVLFTALIAYWLLLPSDGWLLTLAAIAVAVAATLLVLAARAVWPSPTNRQVARFIEEQCPELEDRLASATDCETSTELRGVMGPRVMADAASRVRDLDLDRVVKRAAIHRASGLTAAAVAVLCLVGYVGRKPAARAIDLASLYAFPGHVRIEVSPGHVRLPAGQALVVSARVTGARQVSPNLALVSGSARRGLPMRRATDPDRFEITLGGVTADFKYAVEAGSARSAVYDVTVVNPPRVERIDLRYSYPKAFGLEPRVEQNGGDIYGPAGTKVQIDVHADKALRAAALVLADGTRVPLSTGSGTTARTEVELTEDTSYRVALNDQDGLTSHGDTEYFIRLLNDRPPDVRILQPAGDTQVTALEEVTIEARADDDHGIDRFDLVYAVRGGNEKVVPFHFDRSQPTAEGRQVVFMEDLGVKPGDFVTYFARARDVSRGKRSTEARSDIFFLEVKPFDEEFSLAQSQAMAGGGGSSAFDDLAAAEKEIIIATWKLDRRALGGQAGRSADDVRAIASAQGQLRVKTEHAAQAQGGLSAGRRRRPRAPGEEPTNENPLGLAVQAMTRAESSLGSLDTKGALPHEMEALNQLLKAQSEIRRFQISRQQASGGMGGYGRQGQDLSALFDRELQRQQQTNYENPNTSEQRRDDATNDALDKVRELARRQDELAKQQQDLARQKEQVSAEELKRQLERLTREQSELRRQAEELSQQMARQQSQGRGEGKSKSGGGSSGRGDNNENGRMKDISEEMRNAASDLRREDLERASERSGRAGEMLRQLERQLGDKQPNERARRLGDVQLEARQLADAQQRVASEVSRMTKGTSADELRRLAGEKDRLADRTEALAEAVKRAAHGIREPNTPNAEAQALGDAVKQLERQQLDRRMRESAGRLRTQGEAAASQGQGEPRAGQPPTQPRVSEADARNEQELLQSYERLADRLSGATSRLDKDTDRLSDNMARTQELRQRWEQLSRDQQRLRDQAARGGGPDQGARQSGAASGREGSSQGPPGGARGGREGSQGSSAGPGGSNDLARLRDEQQRQMRQAEELMDELRQMNPGLSGRTPEGQQMVTSAPGTEAFKQDFSKWDQLRKAIDAALEQTERSLSQSLRERQAKDRLNAGAGDHTPEQYRKLVEKYYQALAAKKK
ncbi:MAG: hypothetical protein HYS05_22005 [Acidobacteria bacterium]|nr:hypothetical protein [Acidobacteriota bacterium]